MQLYHQEDATLQRKRSLMTICQFRDTENPGVPEFSLVSWMEFTPLFRPEFLLS